MLNITLVEGPPRRDCSYDTIHWSYSSMAQMELHFRSSHEPKNVKCLEHIGIQLVLLLLSGHDFAPGTIVSVPCEIHPGMSSFEKEVKIRMPAGTITGLVNQSSVIENLRRVRAVVMIFDTNDIRLLFPGQDMHPSNPAFVPLDWLKENAQLED